MHRLVFLIPYAAVQVMGIGYLLAGISKGAIPFLGAMVLAMVLALVWSNVAGLRSVAWTDAMQAIVMLLAFITAVCFMTYREFGGFGGFAEQMNKEIPQLLAGPGLFTFDLFFGLSLPWLFFSVSNPQVTQRLFIPKSVRSFKQMIGGFLVFGFVYTMVSVLWGFGARLLIPGLDNADTATPALLALPIFPKLVVVIVMIGILAAAISTIDSILLTLSSMCARDIYKGGINPRASEEMELRMAKRVIPILALIFFVFAFWAAGQKGLAFMIAPLSAAASAELLMAVPTIIGAFFWKRASPAGALSSMIVGAILVLFFQVTGRKSLGLWPGVWALIVCHALYIVVSLMTTAPTQKAEEFIHYLRDALPKGNFF